MFTAKDKPAEQKRVVEFLSRSSKVPITEIARIYAKEEIALEGSARIKKFIPVFLIRNVRAQLNQIEVNGSMIPMTEAVDLPA